ncbi:hypothetical protein AXF42_Ash003724 [Apostasia shenzhenica]|uniref:Uncharacterized protein n=1 Tax=Apostasia shenzhenica TaxID=1088818 RepID=A0A2I0AHR2_9ASPA|nr:hypothetical protein AXF42_Ash003724 [Apostasia shenzhenica]
MNRRLPGHCALRERPERRRNKGWFGHPLARALAYFVPVFDMDELGKSYDEAVLADYRCRLEESKEVADLCAHLEKATRENVELVFQLKAVEEVQEFRGRASDDRLPKDSFRWSTEYVYSLKEFVALVLELPGSTLFWEGKVAWEDLEPWERFHGFLDAENKLLEGWTNEIPEPGVEDKSDAGDAAMTSEDAARRARAVKEVAEYGHDLLLP